MPFRVESRLFLLSLSLVLGQALAEESPRIAREYDLRRLSGPQSGPEAPADESGWRRRRLLLTDPPAVFGVVRCASTDDSSGHELTGYEFERLLEAHVLSQLEGEDIEVHYQYPTYPKPEVVGSKRVHEAIARFLSAVDRRLRRHVKVDVALVPLTAIPDTLEVDLEDVVRAAGAKAEVISVRACDGQRASAPI